MSLLYPNLCCPWRSVTVVVKSVKCCMETCYVSNMVACDVTNLLGGGSQLGAINLKRNVKLQGLLLP